MKYKALIGFSGVVSAHKGQVVEIANDEIAQDLLSAGYIEAAKAVKKATKAVKADEPVEE